MLFNVWLLNHLKASKVQMLWLLFSLSSMCSGSFCTIRDCRLVELPGKESQQTACHGVMRGKCTLETPMQCLHVRMQTDTRTLGVRIHAMAYYFAEDRNLIDSMRPFPIQRENGTSSAMPTYFEAGRPDVLCFPIPKIVDTYAVWHAIVTVGDTNEMSVTTYPRGVVSWGDYEFPEKGFALNPLRMNRVPDVNPLVEYVHETGIVSHPKITFFLRKPKAVSTFQKARGVLALCLLGHDVDDVKRRLQEAEAKDDLTDVLRFAEDNNLTLLCWGAQRFWNPRMNWDDLTRMEGRVDDTMATDMADAWEMAVRRLVGRYEIQSNGYLLSGFSGAAQYALRLAMKKPQYFLSVHVHVPSSFPKPIPEAKNLLLCVTTGEWETGYDRSIHFLEEAQTAGLSVVYKAIPELGHATHPQATRLGIACFKYVLENPDSRTWRPLYRGDVYRQSVFPASRTALGEGIWVDLPSRSIATAWL